MCELPFYYWADIDLSILLLVSFTPSSHVCFCLCLPVSPHFNLLQQTRLNSLAWCMCQFSHTHTCLLIPVNSYPPTLLLLTFPQTHHILSHFQVFAHAVPSAWNTFPPLPLVNFYFSFKPQPRSH